MDRFFAGNRHLAAVGSVLALAVAGFVLYATLDWYVLRPVLEGFDPFPAGLAAGLPALCGRLFMVFVCLWGAFYCQTFVLRSPGWRMLAEASALLTAAFYGASLIGGYVVDYLVEAPRGDLLMGVPLWQEITGHIMAGLVLLLLAARATQAVGRARHLFAEARTPIG